MSDITMSAYCGHNGQNFTCWAGLLLSEVRALTLRRWLSCYSLDFYPLDFKYLLKQKSENHSIQAILELSKSKLTHKLSYKAGGLEVKMAEVKTIIYIICTFLESK